MTSKEKLNSLRAAMQAQGLAAYIIPSADPHQGEYVADHWKSRAWVSGFTGSAATVVLTAGVAGLWTDSRYYIQAETQLKDSGFTLFKAGMPNVPEFLDWLRDNLPAGSRVGLDGRLFSVAQVRRMAKQFKEKKIELVANLDLIAGAWTDRPTLPQAPVFEHDVVLAGATRLEKLAKVREKMGSADFYFISTLDDIAWLFNLRGSDVECNPVFYAFAMVGKEAAWLFMEAAKLPEAIKQKLNDDGVLVMPYDSIEAFLKNIQEGQTVQIDLASINNQHQNAIKPSCIKEGDNIVAELKAIKNATEIAHLKNTMARDGAALVRIFHWLEAELPKRTVPEAEVAERLTAFRSELPNYFGDSFDAIVGYKGNGAIVHYRPEYGTCANIEANGILLLDSGGQYTDGTTDITRTIALSAPSELEKTDFTLVLKGVLGLSMACFPKGTNGIQLDTLARWPIWQHHVNFGHGVGHGVGFFLNVHEGPHGFSPLASSPRSGKALEPGTVTSNEPGIYRAGQHGIRTENLILCVEDKDTEFGKFYRFETLTLFPIDLALVNKEMLSDAERNWLNAYHEECYERISPYLDAEEKTWLRQKCGNI
ncbi:MAG: aminopeptidase P family N-terminal domain-containing protein [Saprospiraceae bacterium]|nr:aminopeptidase P family N-terminal domain-containing protein [Saprospiraceae bacterium]